MYAVAYTTHNRLLFFTLALSKYNTIKGVSGTKKLLDFHFWENLFDRLVLGNNNNLQRLYIWSKESFKKLKLSISFFFQRKLRLVELQNSTSFIHTCIFPIDEIAKMKLRKILSY